MKTSFSTSANILRDSGRNLKYISTPNASRVVAQISSDFFSGIHSFNIIGSYGTGKSSFLLALEQSLVKENKIFQSELFAFKEIEPIKFVGAYGSLLKEFSEVFGVPDENPKKIFSEIFNIYHDLGEEKSLIVIIIDEFGKFLEYAAKNNPEKELYFIQELAEFVNDPAHNIILVTTVHQNFDAYAFGLSYAQRQEWTKVKGRFKEITFNEPIEQLLYLASERLNNQSSEYLESQKIRKALKLAIESRAFNINPTYAEEIAEKMFPLEMISANVLTISLQKYGQNERSLFTFLETESNIGVSLMNPERSRFFSLPDVYDYLIQNFYSFINSRFNPDFANWTSIKNALETAERTFDKNLEYYSSIIKSIGLLNLTAAHGSDLGEDFLNEYVQLCLGIPESESLISDLVSKKIIIYRNYNKRFSLFEGTDLDITEALFLAENKVGEVLDVVSLLKKEYDFSPLLAKSYSFVFGTPRLFEFVISSDPIDQIPEGDIDGFVNLIFNEEISEDKIIEISKNQEDGIVYGYFSNFNTIRNQLFEIEKTRKVLDENTDDRVAKNELNNILQHQKNLLNHFILNNLYSENTGVR
ncbi:MAG: ATP-binding protein, partial [Candidatus Paceibacterota bacterium]